MRKPLLLFALALFCCTNPVAAQCPAGSQVTAERSFPTGARELLMCGVGDKDVLVQFWYPNGRLRYEATAAPGDPGTPVRARQWTETGTLVHEVIREADGTWIKTLPDLRTSGAQCRGPVTSLTWFDNFHFPTGTWTCVNAAGERTEERVYREARGEAEDAACHGVVLDRIIEYGPGGVVLATQRFEHCQVHGTVTQYYPTGEKAAEITYDRGRVQGPPLRWTPDGRALVTLISDGERVRAVSRDEQGRTLSETTYRGVILDGPFVEFFSSGQKKREGSYREGAQEGTWQEWYDDDTLKEVGTFRGGRLSGRRQTWYTDGTPSSDEHYEDGRPVGLHRRWNSLGILTELACYSTPTPGNLPVWRVTTEDEANQRSCVQQPLH